MVAATSISVPLETAVAVTFVAWPGGFVSDAIENESALSDHGDAVPRRYVTNADVVPVLSGTWTPLPFPSENAVAPPIVFDDFVSLRQLIVWSVVPVTPYVSEW